MDKTLQALIDTVETWNVLKKTGREFNQKDVRTFIETMNAHTRKLINIFEKEDPEFYTGLFELGQHACTMTTPNAKVFVDGIDRTHL
jgi:hypothetical protein